RTPAVRWSRSTRRRCRTSSRGVWKSSRSTSATAAWARPTCASSTRARARGRRHGSNGATHRRLQPARVFGPAPRRLSAPRGASLAYGPRGGRRGRARSQVADLDGQLELAALEPADRHREELAAQRSDVVLLAGDVHDGLRRSLALLAGFDAPHRVAVRESGIAATIRRESVGLEVDDQSGAGRALFEARLDPHRVAG